MAEQSPDPWRILWRFVTSNAVLVALLLVLAMGMTLTAWIPQQPSSDMAYARWRSQVQARFGEATSLMRAFGLFTITSSLGFRLLLAVLSGCVFLHVVEGLDRLLRDRETTEPDGGWRQVSDQQLGELLDRLRRRQYRVVNATSLIQVDRWPWSDALPLMAYLGVLILLFSLLLSHLFGWRIEGLILQSGERRSLPGGDHWVTLTEDGSETHHSPGIVAFIGESGPGVQVSALDEGEEPLHLLLTADAEPSTELSIPLNEDTYFAIPEAELVVRLMPRSKEPYALADVEIYSSPSGEKISERVTDKGVQATFQVEGVTLSLVPAPYARVMVTHNPGRVPAGLGMVMLMVGVVGSLMWSERCFWLREGGDAVEAAGPFPLWLQVEGEDL